MRLSMVIARLGEIYLKEGDINVYIENDNSTAHLQAIETDRVVFRDKTTRLVVLSQWVEPTAQKSDET